MRIKEFTRKGFKAWLIERWDQTIGVQGEETSCAIAQFVLEKIPNCAEANIGFDSEEDIPDFSYFDSEKKEWINLPQRLWTQDVIDKFDDLPGTPTGADLLRALGWVGKHG